MKIIGITGPSGAGKSKFCKYAGEMNISVIDADKVYHSLLIPPSPCLDKLRENFGDSVFNEDGSLHRKTLATIVFSAPEKLELLNSTVLGFVLDKIRDIIAEIKDKGASLVLVDAPTLIESGFHRECDTVISVLSQRDLRIKRISERDDITIEKATERVNAQKSDDFYRAASDHVLENDGDEIEFEKISVALLNELLK